MLNLASDTPVTWVASVLPNFDEVLIDHAHCEKKAASTAVALMFRYPHHTALLRPLSELAREELTHFEQVLDLLGDRGVAFRRITPSPYAAQLRQAVRPGEPDALVDTLLCCALIEARSCERMKLLSQHHPDAVIRAFYGELLTSEARHFAVYHELAEVLVPRAPVRERLAELAQHEAAVLAGSPWLDRLHGGHQMSGNGTSMP